MKAKIIILFIISILATHKTFAQNYESDIKNLQQQIDELNKKINKQENNWNKYLNGLSFNGRLHIDGNWYDRDDELNSYSGNPYKNKFLVKRARVSMSKQIDSFLFNFEGNFNSDKAYLGENYIAYNINKNNTIRVGQVLALKFIETWKSSNTMAVIDYNAPVRMDWFKWYLIGSDYFFTTNNFGIQAGIFGNGTNEESNIKNDIKYNFSFRSFYTPIRNEDYLIHIGADFIYQGYNEDIANNPNEVDYNYYYILELILQYKYISFTNEYSKGYYKYQDTRFNGNKFNFDSLSTEFVINFTGEKTIYSKYGCLDNINVNNPLSKDGLGAFQGVLRYSFADGKDTSKGYLNNIGSLYEYTIGVNWIPENYFRVLLNYSRNRVTGINYSYKGKYDAFKLEFRMFF